TYGAFSSLAPGLTSPYDLIVVYDTQSILMYLCHSDALLVLATLGFSHDLTRGLVGSCEPGTHHHVRSTRGQRQGDIARMAYTSVRPHVFAEFARGRRTFQHRGELRASHGRHHAGRAHCPRADPVLDDDSAGLDP